MNVTKRFALLMCVLLLLTAFSAFAAARGERCERCEVGTVRKIGPIEEQISKTPTSCQNTYGETDFIVVYRYTTTYKCNSCIYEKVETYDKTVRLCDHGPHNGG